jgi:hypothetical protein
VGGEGEVGGDLDPQISNGGDNGEDDIVEGDWMTGISRAKMEDGALLFGDRELMGAGEGKKGNEGIGDKRGSLGMEDMGGLEIVSEHDREGGGGQEKIGDEDEKEDRAKDRSLRYRGGNRIRRGEIIADFDLECPSREKTLYPSQEVTGDANRGKLLEEFLMGDRVKSSREVNIGYINTITPIHCLSPLIKNLEHLKGN